MSNELKFTEEQKDLIWRRFIQPNNGTDAEALQFIEICETFGLNPLLGDIVFQKFKSGRVNFITTRDGLLRVATRQDGYVGAPNANVVKEGDEFEFIPSKGEVHHRFGQKRGNILGAYAVMRHEKFIPVAVFVDFDEYFNANSGLGNNRRANVWDSMPSAMIVKVAEVFVLRRQFPLGGLYTREEMSLEEPNEPINQQPQQNQNNANPNQQQTQQQTDGFKNGQTQNNAQATQQGQQPVQQNQPVQQQGNNQNQNQDKKVITDEQISELNNIVDEISEVRNVKAQSVKDAIGTPIEQLTEDKFNQVKNQLTTWLSKAKERSPQNTTSNEQAQVGQQNQQVDQPTNNETQNNQKAEQPTNQGNKGTLTLVSKEDDVGPNGITFVKLRVKETDKPIFARTDEVKQATEGLNVNDQFTASIVVENDFMFLENVQKVQAA